MIAYNQEQLDNRDINEEAEKAFKKQYITAEELAQIKAAHPVTIYTPNMYLRIGLFILTLIIALFSFGFLSLIVLAGSGGSESKMGALCVFFSMVAYFVLEVLIREKQHFKSGADTALMWISGGMMLTGILLAVSGSNEFLIGALTCLFATWFLIRFADLVMAWVAQLAFLFCVAWLFQGLKLLLPFLMISISFGMYYFLRLLLKEEKLRHYRTCFHGMQVLALLTLYVGGNFFVVQNVNEDMFGEKTVPFSWIFWILTVALPLVYLYYGLRTKDKIFVRTGLVLVAAIVFTIRYYHSVAPLEVAMTIGGLFMVGLAYGVIRYLKEPKHGFTSEEEEEKGTFEALQLESLVIAQTMKSGPQPEEGFKFGGGTSGGGGASGDY